VEKYIGGVYILKKKLITLVAILSLLSIIAACGSSGSGGDVETYTVATDANFKPFEYKNPDTGEMEGFDIELMEAIAKEAGFEVEFETMEFDGLIAGMQSGRYPIGIAGISITEERKESIDFSNPYYDSGLVLMVPTDSDIQSIDDVDGKKVGSRQGSTSQSYLQDNTDADVQAFPEIVTAYMDVKEGRVDAALYDLPNVLYYIAQEGEGKLKTVGDVIEGQSYGIAFPKDSEIVGDVNEALESLIADGTYAEIYEEYFGEAPPEKWLGE
jgi:glutamine transport system substrate-binding protein